MSRKRKQYDDDDGRVIANMNVDGMPWYQRSERKLFGAHSNRGSDFSDLTKEDTREIIKGALKASLLIAGIFILAMLLFILFCLYIWF
ncbi:MAG: hypothetical protein J6S18_02690 [Oscillospiraceae bacterium]|nr:hypothetical protein [Oscillospiraceae bacterium]